MSRREWKAFAVLFASCIIASIAVGVGLKLLDANDEVASLAFIMVVVIGGLGGGYAYDRYTHPPEKS